MTIVKHSTPEHIYESIEDIPKQASPVTNEETQKKVSNNNSLATGKPNDCANTSITKPYPFNTYRQLLTLLYGALFSYTVTFILHNLELCIDESVEPVTVLWIFVGFLMGCSQIFISWEIWRSWTHAKKSISIVWLAQCVNFIMMMVHNVLYQDEMHRFYHGFFIFISIISILLLASYGHSKSRIDRCDFGLSYLFKSQKVL